MTKLEWSRGYWTGVAVGFVGSLVVGVSACGCAPHDAKHYRTLGQAQHYANCRPKCAATTSGQWHERRKP